MSVYFCIPSCRPRPEAEECLRRWKSLGYKIAILRQGELLDPDLVDLQIPTGEYLGWPTSTNLLCKAVLRKDINMHFCVGGGDDYWPVPDISPNSIAPVLLEHFYSKCLHKVGYAVPRHAASTFGVMQPTGDRWGDNESSRATYGQDRGAIIDRVAGSPWMGREWIERSYQGNGPMFSGYHHLYADEELCEVAERFGVYWRRPDLVQYHNHPSRGEKGFQACNEGHLAPLYSAEAWVRERAIFDDRKAKGFPGSDPIDATSR